MRSWSWPGSLSRIHCTQTSTGFFGVEAQVNSCAVTLTETEFDEAKLTVQPRRRGGLELSVFKVPVHGRAWGQRTCSLWVTRQEGEVNGYIDYILTESVVDCPLIVTHRWWESLNRGTQREITAVIRSGLMKPNILNEVWFQGVYKYRCRECNAFWPWLNSEGRSSLRFSI
jgi:hypothetical protein